MARVLIRGSGDVGSAVAHLLLRSGHDVVIHDVALPAAPRRGMAFADAIFDGACELDGVRARRVDATAALRGESTGEVLLTTAPLRGRARRRCSPACSSTRACASAPSPSGSAASPR